MPMYIPYHHTWFYQLLKKIKYAFDDLTSSIVQNRETQKGKDDRKFR